MSINIHSDRWSSTWAVITLVIVLKHTILLNGCVGEFDLIKMRKHVYNNAILGNSYSVACLIYSYIYLLKLVFGL